MGLSGKKVAQVDIKCNGDVLFGLFMYRPNNVAKLAPDHIQVCELHEGEWGTLGSIVSVTFKLDGMSIGAKATLEAASEKNKSITYKFLEGPMLQIYKSLKVSFQISTENGDENNINVTWTIEYEKMNEDVPDPDALIDLISKLTKVIETHFLK